MAVIEGSLSGNLAEVNSSNELKTVLPADADRAGYVKPAFSNGAVWEGTEDGHGLVSEDTIILFDQIDGNAINTNIWNASDVSGMTVTQSGGFITLNAGAATTANAYAILKSIKHIPLYPEFPTFIAIDGKVNVSPQANVTIEVGIGNPSGSSALTDGVLFRMAPDGSFKAVTINTSSETTSLLTGVSTNVMHDFDISIEVDDAEFEVDDDQAATIDNPPGIPYAVGTTRLPIFIRVINGSSAPGTAPQISIGRVSVIQKVLKPLRPWGESLALLGRGMYQSPVTTFAQLANHANSTSPSSATLSNTAAGYTTLGGRYQFAAVSGAATDFALFAYQIPTGYQAFITGIRISNINTGAAVATTGTVFDWSLGVNSSAVSLATVDGAGTWAPRRIPLGVQGYEIADGVGEWAETIDINFTVPVVCDSGRYIHIILQCPVGTNTGSEVFRGDVMLNGYFE